MSPDAVRPASTTTAGRRALRCIGGVVAAALLLVGCGTGGLGGTAQRQSTLGKPGPAPAISAVPSRPPSAAVRTLTVAPTSSSTPAKVITKTVTAAPTATAAPAVDFAAIYKKQQSGVIRIETISCTNAGVGTGFLLSPTLVATVDHVVAQAAVVSLISGTQHTTGTVIGSDPSRDLALVRADEPLTGYNFHFATVPPSVGDRVAAIGFPIGNPVTMTQGAISGLNREVPVDGVPRTGLVETDTALNPGNSGGPLMAADGSVVGLVDAGTSGANGIGYAVASDTARTADQEWAAAPVPQPPAACQNPLGPSQQPSAIPAPIPGSGSQAQINGIVDALNRYFGGIDSGDYPVAYSVLAPNRQAAGSEAEFAKGLLTSYDSNILITAAQLVDPNTVTADLTFNSLQTAAYGPDGDTCDNWTLEFTMRQQDDGTWRIDGAQPHNGSTHTHC